MQLAESKIQPTNTTTPKWVPNVSHLPYTPKTFVATQTPTVTVTQTLYGNQPTVLPQTKQSASTTELRTEISFTGDTTVDTTQTLFDIASSTDTYTTVTSTNTVTETVVDVKTEVEIGSTVTETKNITSTIQLISTRTVTITTAD